MFDGLEKFAIFEGLTAEELDAVGQHCEITTAKKGELIFKAGDPAHSLFLVRSGRTEVRFKVVYYAATVEISLDTIGAGEVCGWSAMIPPYSYTLTAYALDDAEFVQIKHTDLLDCCEGNTRLGYIVMKNIARIIGERYESARRILVGEVQSGLRQKDPLA